MSFLGHNLPPETEFETLQSEIDNLYCEASIWIDGKTVKNQAEADKIGQLLTCLRDAIKRAESCRKVEVAPLDAQKKEIQARYGELIGATKSITGKAVRASHACKAALAPYLAELDRQQRQKAIEARERADQAKREADQAIQSSNVVNLAERELAENQLKEALLLQKTAKFLENQKAQVSVNGRKSIVIKTVYEPEIVNLAEVAKHYWQTRPTELREMFEKMVASDVFHGSRQIPGVKIHEKKVAV